MNKWKVREEISYKDVEKREARKQNRKRNQGHWREKKLHERERGRGGGSRRGRGREKDKERNQIKSGEAKKMATTKMENIQFCKVSSTHSDESDSRWQLHAEELA